jgi:hypothetical protein
MRDKDALPEDTTESIEDDPFVLAMAALLTPLVLADVERRQAPPANPSTTNSD